MPSPLKRTLLPSAASSSRRGTFAIALAVQAALLAATVLIMVRQDAAIEPPDFEGERAATAAIDPNPRRDKQRQLQQRMSKPRSFQRLAVDNPQANDLPPAPALPQDAFDLDSNDQSLMQDAQDMMAQSGLLDAVGGLAGRASATEFFGVRDSGRRIVIIVNTSASVVRKASSRGVSIEQIQEEAAKLIDGLDSGTLFGIVQFSQGSRSFAPRLAPALKRNKEKAATWAREELKGNPRIEDERWLGHEAAMYEAMRLQPDLIFLVTDGSLNRRERSPGGGYTYPKISFEQLFATIDREMRSNGAKPRIHVIGFELGAAEREGLQRLSRRYGGTLREF